MFPINPAFRRLVGDYEDKSQLGFECGKEVKGGTFYEAADTLDDLRKCGWSPSWSGEDYKIIPKMIGGKKVQIAYPWMEHKCFNLCSQIN